MHFYDRHVHEVTEAQQNFAKKKTRLREQIVAKMGLSRLQLERFFQCKRGILSWRALVRGSKKGSFKEKGNREQERANHLLLLAVLAQKQGNSVVTKTKVESSQCMTVCRLGTSVTK